MSELAVASRLPSGLQAMLPTGPRWPRKVNSSWPLAASHTLAVLSQFPVVWPVRRKSTSDLSLGALSELAVASRLPSGLQATLLTGPGWPRKVSSSWLVAVSQTLPVLSSLAVASRLPSGLQATLQTGAR